CRDEHSSAGVQVNLKRLRICDDLAAHIVDLEARTSSPSSRDETMTAGQIHIDDRLSIPSREVFQSFGLYHNRTPKHHLWYGEPRRAAPERTRPSTALPHCCRSRRC